MYIYARDINILRDSWEIKNVPNKLIATVLDISYL